MIDLLYFQQNDTFGLTERYLFDLVRGVDRSRYNLHLIYPDVPEMHKFSLLGSEGVHLYQLPARLISGNALLIVPQILFMIRRLDPDLIHFNDPAVAGLLAGRLLRNVILVMTHHTPELDRCYGGRGKLLERVAFRGNPFVIFTSENDRRTGMVRDGIRKEDSAVVPYGIDVSYFRGDSNRQKILHELGISPGHRIVGNVARLVTQKGHEYLVEAARIICSQFEDVTFVIVGDGPLREDLAREVARSGLAAHFVFTGQRSDVPRLMNIFDVFVMPSLFEGLCMAVLEALAAGIPVVATNVGGIPSTVVDGETGTLVSSRDADSLAKGIIWMLEHTEEARVMGATGKRRVQEEFSMGAMFAGTEAVYERLLFEHTRRIEIR